MPAAIASVVAWSKSADAVGKFIRHIEVVRDNSKAIEKMTLFFEFNFYHLLPLFLRSVKASDAIAANDIV
jgi:hypothetical protein